MRRRVIIAVGLAVLAATALPAQAAGTNLAVASIHTTSGDFQNAATLTNVSVVSGAVTFADDATLADFESGSLTGYGGDTADYTVQSNVVLGGSFSLNGTVSDAVISETGVTVKQGDTINASVQSAGGGTIAGVVIYTQDETATPGGYRIIVDSQNGVFRISELDGSGGSSILANDLGVSLSADTEYQIQITTDTGGTIRARLYDPSGSELADIQATDNTYTSGGIGFDTDAIDAGEASVYDDVINVGTGGPDGRYISANHTAENASQAFTNLSTLTNAEVTVEWQNWTGSSWNVVDTSTYTTAGNKTVDISAGATSTKWRVNVTFVNQTTNGVPDVVLADEGVQFVNHAPDVDNASATPTGGLSSAMPTLQIDVNDTDFPLAQSDSVDVAFSVDGSAVGTDTLTSNGTASVTLSSGLTGGDHTWSVWANDSYGGTQISQTFTISAPANVTIREETEPHPIVKNATGVEVRIFGSDNTLVKRNVTDGNISLTGLPTDESYVFVVDPDGYHQRSIVIQDLFEQNQIYVLNKSRPSVRVNYELDDSTGRFEGQSDTVLTIQKAINRSLYDPSAPEEYQWEAIGGDRIGATNQFAIDLEEGDRYRILVSNGVETRVLGEYTADADADPEILPVGQLSFSGDTTGGAAVDARLREFGDGDRDIRIVYYDAEDATSSLDINVTNLDTGNVLQDVTVNDPTQTHVETVPVPAGAKDNATFVVIVNATRSGAPNVDESIRVGSVNELTDGWPIDGQVLSLIGWVLWFATTGLVALRSPAHAPAAAVIVGFAFTMLGIYHIPPALMGIGGTLAVAALVAGDQR